MGFYLLYVEGAGMCKSEMLPISFKSGYILFTLCLFSVVNDGFQYYCTVIKVFSDTLIFAIDL